MPLSREWALCVGIEIDETACSRTKDHDLRLVVIDTFGTIAMEHDEIPSTAGTAARTVRSKHAANIAAYTDGDLTKAVQDIINIHVRIATCDQSPE
jgi:hypothetical protein